MHFLAAFVFLGLSSCSSTPKTDRDAIKDAIESHRAGIKSCYLDAISRSPGIEGKLLLFWTINKNGQAQNIEVRKSAFADNVLESCVMDIISKIHFRHFPEPTTVLYPIEFKRP